MSIATKVRMLALAGAVAAVAVVAAVVQDDRSAASAAAQASTSAHTFSNRGTSVMLPPERGVTTRERPAWLLAEHSGRAFYRLDSPDSKCFGFGPAGRRDVGTSVCLHHFPYSGPPVYALKTAEGTTRDRADLRLLDVEGFAVDGIETIELTGIDGRVIATAPVIRNTFSIPIPKGHRVLDVQLIARDAAGNEVYFDTP